MAESIHSWEELMEFSNDPDNTNGDLEGNVIKLTEYDKGTGV